MANNPSQYAPNVYHSWGGLMKTVNRDWPSAIRAITIAMRRERQTLAHQRHGRR